MTRQPNPYQTLNTPKRRRQQFSPQRLILRQQTEPLLDYTFRYSTEKRLIPVSQQPLRRKFMIARNSKLPANFFGDSESRQLVRPFNTERRLPEERDNGTPHFNQPHDTERQYSSLVPVDASQSILKASLLSQRSGRISRMKRRQPKTLIDLGVKQTLHEQSKSVEIKTALRKDPLPRQRTHEELEQLTAFGDLLKSLLQKKTKPQTTTQYHRPKISILPPLRFINKQLPEE